MLIDAFIPCFIDQLYPETAASFVKLLEKAGCTVRYNPEQTCCGQPAYNGGYQKEAKTVATKFLLDFRDAEYIVGPSASCTGFVRNYYTSLFAGDPKLYVDAERIKGRIFEFTDFLVNKMNVVDFGAVFPHKVTFHDSCAGLREYKIWQEPRALLSKVKGLELIEMDDTESCCGFGGTFAAKFKHISTAMTQQKLEFASDTGAEYIVSTEASCLLNLQSFIRKQNLGIKTIHIADLLASGI